MPGSDRGSERSDRPAADKMLSAQYTKKNQHSIPQKQTRKKHTHWKTLHGHFPTHCRSLDEWLSLSLSESYLFIQAADTVITVPLEQTLK